MTPKWKVVPWIFSKESPGQASRNWRWKSIAWSNSGISQSAVLMLSPNATLRILSSRIRVGHEATQGTDDGELIALATHGTGRSLIKRS